MEQKPVPRGIVPPDLKESGAAQFKYGREVERKNLHFDPLSRSAHPFHLKARVSSEIYTTIVFHPLGVLAIGTGLAVLAFFGIRALQPAPRQFRYNRKLHAYAGKSRLFEGQWGAI